ncbi:MAG: beta-glucosidase BglX [Saprospiraceae bacterium]
MLFFLSLFSTTKLSGQQDIASRVETLLNKMTLAEKVGQMNQYNGFWDVTGPVPKVGNSKMKYEHLKQGKVGSVLNVRGVENVRKLQEIVVKESRLGIPLIFGQDIIHGFKTLTPIPLAETASWDLEAIQRSARNAAVQASAAGINWTFAPMVDISRDARWGRVMEGAGEDPYLGALVGVARINGFQGEDLTAPNTIASTAKHFAAYGFAEAGREYNTVDVGTNTLYNIVFPPFKAAVENNVKSVMNAFNILNGVPATGDSFLQREMLKDRWGFKGFVISDWGSIKEMAIHGHAEDLKHTAELAAKAGSDMDMESYAYVTHLEALVKEGKVKESLVDDAVRRILTVKMELGLFEDPYLYCNEEREKRWLYAAEHNAAALDMAKRSIVLLKNEKQILPLAKTQQKIAVIGALANDKNSPLGSWRMGSDDGTAISVIEGLTKYGKNFTYAKGADLTLEKANFLDEVKVNETDRSGFAEAVELAKNASVVLMVLGEHGFQSGEGRSRTKLGLPGVQQELLEAVHAVNPNIVLILMNGRPLAIPWAAENIPSILETWQLGTQCGNAIASVLYGDYNPSGKLPMTFPRSVGQVPIYYNHFSTGRPVSEGNVFWSHYSDQDNTPLYPFGFGLSYTQFKYSALSVDASNPKAVKVMVTVTNVGNRTGEEVAQLYIRDKVASVARPVKELKGFQKFSLAPKMAKQLSFILTEKELGFYNTHGKFIVEPGSFEVQVGTNSQEVLVKTFELK